MATGSRLACTRTRTPPHTDASHPNEELTDTTAFCSIHLAVGYPGVTDPIATRTMINTFLDWAQQQVRAPYPPPRPAHTRKLTLSPPLTAQHVDRLERAAARVGQEPRLQRQHCQCILPRVLGARRARDPIDLQWYSAERAGLVAQLPFCGLPLVRLPLLRVQHSRIVRSGG